MKLNQVLYVVSQSKVGREIIIFFHLPKGLPHGMMSFVLGSTDLHFALMLGSLGKLSHALGQLESHLKLMDC